MTPVSQNQPSVYPSTQPIQQSTRRHWTIWLIAGTVILSLSIFVVFKLIPPEVTNPPTNESSSRNEPGQNYSTWRTGEAIDFKFQYPQGWHALSGVNESTRYFRLDPEPLYVFPEYTSFIEGNVRWGKEKSVLDLEEEVNYFLSTTYPKIEKLDWKNEVFPGECYKYDTVSDQWGELKGNIECLIEITVPANLPDKQLTRYIYEFSVLNYDNPIKKIDPDLSITKRFIESIHP